MWKINLINLNLLLLKFFDNFLLKAIFNKYEVKKILNLLICWTIRLDVLNKIK